MFLSNEERRVGVRRTWKLPFIDNKKFIVGSWANQAFLDSYTIDCVALEKIITFFCYI